MVRSSRPSSRSRIANEYSSSPPAAARDPNADRADTCAKLRHDPARAQQGRSSDRGTCRSTLYGQKYWSSCVNRLGIAQHVALARPDERLAMGVYFRAAAQPALEGGLRSSCESRSGSVRKSGAEQQAVTSISSGVCMRAQRWCFVDAHEGERGYFHVQWLGSMAGSRPL